MNYKVKLFIMSAILVCLAFSINAYAKTIQDVSFKNNLEVNGENDQSFQHFEEKPTIVIPDLQVQAISNSWGKVSFDTTTINTEILINDPDFYLVALEVNCEIYLNEVKIVSEIGKNLQITRCASESRIFLTNTINNDNFIKWLVSHINNDEKTTVRIEGELIISLDKVDLSYPFTQKSEFETDILKELGGRDLASINLVEVAKLKIESLQSKWGKVSLAEAEIGHELMIFNWGWLPTPIMITDVNYQFAMNEIQVAKGHTGLPFGLLPGERKPIAFTTKINNKNLIRWWVSHIKNGEKTKYCFNYTLMMKWFGAQMANWPNKVCGTFETDFFSKKE